jgi:hypothetical protein
MTPTLNGRIQTRWFLLGTVGVLWTLIVTPFLAGAGPLGDTYRITFTALAIVVAAGTVWEFVYHALQQIRWEKDWPGIFGLVTGLPEGVTTWLALNAVLDDKAPFSAFIVHFATTWIAVWLVANGPMRVVLIRWRFRGGAIV